MSLVVMGISHKTASIEQRGRAAVAKEDVPSALSALTAAEGVKGAVVLSTCNRVEAYLEAKTDRLGADALATFFRAKVGEEFDETLFYLFRGGETVRHAYRVASSLDSQLLGEAQILGQMRRAYEQANRAGACSETLSRLFTTAFRLGKRVRTETAIGSDSVSLSTAAYKVACDSVPDIACARVLLIGAGEMALLTAKYLREGGVAELYVTTRTPEHADAFAREAGAVAVPFEERVRAAAESDVVFSMTNATEPVIRADDLARERSDAGRPDAVLVFIDEAVPRDIEPACADLPGVRLFDLEALSAIVDDGLAQRMSAVSQVERMVAQAESEFLAWMQERLVVPTIKAVYEKGEYTVHHELDHAVRELEKRRGAPLDERELATLDAYGHAIMKKLLHGPIVRLRKEAQTADSYYYTGAARYLFGVETFPPGTHHRCADRSRSQRRAWPEGLPPDVKRECADADDGAEKGDLEDVDPWKPEPAAQSRSSEGEGHD